MVLEETTARERHPVGQPRQTRNTIQASFPRLYLHDPVGALRKIPQCGQQWAEQWHKCSTVGQPSKQCHAVDYPSC